MELVDIGVNLTNRSLLRDLDGVMRRAADAGVRQLVVTGTSLEEIRFSLAEDRMEVKGSVEAEFLLSGQKEGPEARDQGSGVRGQDPTPEE